MEYDEERFRRLELDVELLKARAIEDVKDEIDHEDRLRQLEKVASELRGFTKAITFLASSGVLGSVAAIIVGLSGHH